MINLIKRILRNKFVKVSSANGIITIAKSLLTIIANKVVATIIGTTGIAMVGQLQNFISIITLFSNGGFNQGLTKYIAEDTNEEKTILDFIGTAFIITFAVTLLTAFIILIFSNTIAFKIFSNPRYTSIIIIFACTLIFYNLNSLILAIVNGFQLYRQYFKISITTTAVGTLLTISLVILFKEYGALLAIVLSQSIVCLFAYLYIKTSFWLKAFSFKYYNKEKLLLLLKYTAVTVSTAIIWPIVALIIRTYVIDNISAHEAGLWQATRNINDFIVTIAVGSFSVYLLPKLSSITDKQLLKSELIGIYKIIIPITLVGFLTIYLLREYIILLLYTKEFVKVGHYLLLQMIGSFFWMCKVPIMNYMLAKGKTKIYLINELSFAFLYVVLCTLFIPLYKVQGIQLSFAIYNFLYFVVNIFLVRKFLREPI